VVNSLKHENPVKRMFWHSSARPSKARGARHLPGLLNG